MQGLIRGYGRWLTAFFFAAVALWSVLLILAPQAAIVEASLLRPERQLDSSIARQLAADAGTCALILERRRDAQEETSPALGGGIVAPSPSTTRQGTGSGGGLAVPSPSTTRQGTGSGGGLAVPSPSTTRQGTGSGGGLAVPSPSTTRTAPSQVGPIVLQCERATTRQRLYRGGGSEEAEPVWLDEVYGLERVTVTEGEGLEEQIARARRVREIATAAVPQIEAAEAQASPYGFDNFAQLYEARLIPLTDATRPIERADPINILQRLVGLRFERDGDVYVRIGLVTLFMTLLYAAMATVLALFVCYPIAYNLALASGPRKAAWLMLALLVPYAIVELMRVYAWLSLIDSNGLFNRILIGIGVIAEDAPIEFKRSPMTVFTVIVYTYILFMMFPLVNVLSTLDRAQIDAARDLGASTWRVHRRVVLPHAKPGVAVGCIALFVLAAGAFSVPRIISRGLQGQWFAQTIYDKFFESGASNVGAAYTLVFTLTCFTIVGLFMWAMRARLSDFLRA